MSDLVDNLVETTVFSTVQANLRYWKLKLYERDRGKTAFKFLHGLYKISKRPVGLEKSPEPVQKAMDVILVPIRRPFTLFYLDDLVFLSESSHGSVKQISPVLRLMFKAMATPN